jgi:PBP1b-binding outer membrane lipoprotein LpoB
MNKKLILIVLLAILSACSDRDEEVNPQIKTESSKIEKELLKVSSKTVIDSIKTHNKIDENNSYPTGFEIVDPTKPDKPW